MKNREAVFPEMDLFLPAPQAITPPTQNAGGFIRGIGAIPLVPVDVVESSEKANIPRWYPTTFFMILRDFFSCLVTGQSDLAQREAFADDCEPSKVIFPEFHKYQSDEMQCVPCGNVTRDWIIATYSNGECVCRKCWPEYARVRFRSTIPLRPSTPAMSGGGGGVRCTADRSPRRYFLEQ